MSISEILSLSKKKILKHEVPKPTYDPTVEQRVTSKVEKI